MTKRLFKILTFLMSAVCLLLLVFYRDVSIVDPDKDDICVYIIEGGQRRTVYLPYGSMFKDLKVDCRDYSPEYVLHDKEEIVLKRKEETVISINTANIEELIKLPGIGEKTARKIIVYRETFGPFESIQEIKNVSGIGEKKYEKLKALITV